MIEHLLGGLLFLFQAFVILTVFGLIGAAARWVWERYT